MKQLNPIIKEDYTPKEKEIAEKWYFKGFNIGLTMGIKKGKTMWLKEIEKYSSKHIFTIKQIIKKLGLTL